MTTPSSSFGQHLKELRQARYLTQHELGVLVDREGETIRKYEADKIRPSPIVTGRLAAALGLSTEETATFTMAARCRTSMLVTEGNNECPAAGTGASDQQSSHSTNARFSIKRLMWTPYTMMKRVGPLTVLLVSMLLISTNLPPVITQHTQQVKSQHFQYFGTDTTTGGAWAQHYGTEGAWIAGEATNVPAYVTIAPIDANLYSWDLTMNKAQYLLTIPETSVPSRHVWFDPKRIHIDLQFHDTAWHYVTLYFVDWDGNNARVQEIVVTDLNTGTTTAYPAVIVRQFTGGVYATWRVRGNVQMDVRVVNGNTAVMSGIFFDPAPSNTLETTKLQS